MKRIRSVKLILPGLQLKLVAVFLGLFTLSLGLQFLLLTSALANVAARLPHDGLLLLDELAPLIRDVVLTTACALLPLTLVVGVLATHRFAGPVYRFSRFLEDVIAGKRPVDCKLRNGDQLQDVCALLNEATAPLRTPAGVSAPREAPAPPLLKAS